MSRHADPLQRLRLKATPRSDSAAIACQQKSRAEPGFFVIVTLQIGYWRAPARLAGVERGLRRRAGSAGAAPLSGLAGAVALGLRQLGPARRIGQRAQIGDDRGAVLGLLAVRRSPSPCLSQRPSGESGRVEVVVVPDRLAALGELLHAGRIGKPSCEATGRLTMPHRFGPDLVGAALFAGMAGRAFLEDGCAGFGVGAGQQRRSAWRLRPAPPHRCRPASAATISKPGFSGAGDANSPSETRPTEKTTNTVPSSAPISLLISKESMRPRLPYPAGHSETSACPAAVREATPQAAQIARKLGLLLARCNTYKGASSETFCHFPLPFSPLFAASMTTLILIPARMASTRLPGKPLADIAGRPMIVHVAAPRRRERPRPRGRGDRYGRRVATRSARTASRR